MLSPRNATRSSAVSLRNWHFMVTQASAFILKSKETVGMKSFLLPIQRAILGFVSQNIIGLSCCFVMPMLYRF
jgi:hypothetical protein